MRPSLEVTTVSQRFGRRVAVDRVSFSAGPGVMGLLGPNGAGKSSLLSILATHVTPAEGSVMALGRTAFENGRPGSGLDAVRRDLGYLPQRFEVMGWSSVKRNVEVAAWSQGVPSGEVASAADRALDAVQLTDRARSRARSLSGGMRQRLGIACALAHDPKVVLLDEPTAALDPVQRQGLRDSLALIGQSRVVLISTHIVEDLAHIAERVLVMNEGALIFDGTVNELALHGSPGEVSPLEAGYRAILADGSIAA